MTISINFFYKNSFFVYKTDYNRFSLSLYFSFKFFFICMQYDDKMFMNYEQVFSNNNNSNNSYNNNINNSNRRIDFDQFTDYQNFQNCIVSKKETKNWLEWPIAN